MATCKRTQNGSRKRGVRASRARLYHALTEAGFRSQAALAEKIADLEGAVGRLQQASEARSGRVRMRDPSCEARIILERSLEPGVQP